jgi:hypothetical protein
MDNGALWLSKGIEHGLTGVHIRGKRTDTTGSNSGIQHAINGGGHAKRPIVIAVGARLRLWYPHPNLRRGSDGPIHDVIKEGGRCLNGLRGESTPEGIGQAIRAGRRVFGSQKN